MRSPSEVISASRRAASGAIVMRSSSPSACEELASSNDTGCARSRASAVSACPAGPNSLSESSALPARSESPSGRPLSGACRSLTIRSLAQVNTGARAMRRKSSAAASGRTSKLPTEKIRSVSTSTSGLPCAAFSSVSSCPRAKASASRAAPCTCGRHRNVSGSCRFLAAPSANKALPAISSRRSASDDARPAYGRARAIAGSRIERFAANASRSSAPATSDASSSRSQSATASAAIPVANALLFSNASPSPGSSSPSFAEQAVRDVAHRCEVGLPERAEHANRRMAARVQRIDDALNECWTGRACPACEDVCEHEERRAHRVLRLPARPGRRGG